MCYTNYWYPYLVGKNTSFSLDERGIPSAKR
jgi:hypothetical protein